MRTKQQLKTLRKRLLPATALHPVAIYLRPAALLLLAACLPLFNACRTDDLPGMDSDDTPTTTPEELVGKPVCFGGLTVTEVTTDAATRATTRTATDYNEPGATITVRMTVTPSGNGKSGSGSTTTYADYTCTDEGYWIPVGKPLYWADATSQHTFIAYSPALDATGKNAGVSAVISLPGAWSASLYDEYNNYMQSAEMKTTPVPAISLTLKPLLTRIQVSMTDNETTYGQILSMLMKTRGEITADGTVTVPTATDNPLREVKLWKDGNVFRGYTLPGQTYAQSDPILYYYEKGMDDSQFYQATGDFTTQAGTRLDFTVDALPGFEVNVGSAGGLKSAVEAYASTHGGTYPPCVKITGSLNIDDMRTLASLGNERKIVSVDMGEADVRSEAFGNNPTSNPNASDIPFFNDNSNTPRTGIKSIILPQKLTLIPGYAFGNYSFDNIVLPEALTQTGYSAIYNTNISTLEVPAGFNQDAKYYSSFSGNEKLTTVIIHCPLEKLGVSAFNYCKALSHIILKGKALESTTVKKNTFSGCESLTSLDFLPPSVTTLEENAFYGCEFTSLDIPARFTKVGDSAFPYCKNLQSVTVRARMDEWGNSVFYDASLLTQITFADDALLTEKFSADVFASCTGLTSIELPPKITEISSGQYSYLFSGCSNLKKIAIDGSIAITGKLPQPQYGPKSAELFLYNPSLGQTGDHVTNFAGDTDWAEHSWANVHWGYTGSGDKFDATNYQYHKKTN